jgi:hypothetical protein
MMLRSFAAALVLLPPACATAQTPREQISIDALVADAPAYVAARYRAEELPAALIADLTAQEFQCRQGADASECGRTRHAFASCFDVVTVRISAGAVEAAQNRRCLGSQR